MESYLGVLCKEEHLEKKYISGKCYHTVIIERVENHDSAVDMAKYFSETSFAKRRVKTPLFLIFQKTMYFISFICTHCRFIHVTLCLRYGEKFGTFRKML